MENKVIKFSLGESDINIKEISDSQLAIAEVKVVRSGMNTHKLPVAKECLEKAAVTLYNKYLVAGFSGYDFKGHEKNQFIIGHFPREFDFEIIEDEVEKESFIKATALISKHYAPWAIDILKGIHNGTAAVSMEALATKTEIREDGYEWITEFIFTGVTVLGRRIKPSASGSEIKIVNFTEEDFVKNTNSLWQNVKNREDFWKKSQKLFADMNTPIGDNKRMEDSIKLKAEDKIKDNVIALELAETETEAEKKDETVYMEEETTVEVEVEKEDNPEEEAKEEVEMSTENNEVITEIEKQKQMGMGCGNTEMACETDMACDTKMSDEEKIAFEEMKVKFAEMETELNRLKTFEEEILTEKAIKFEEEKARKVEFTCQEVSGDMPEDKVNEWKSRVIEFSNVDAWANAMKAEAYTFAKDKVKPIETKTHIRMGFGNESIAKPEKKSLWTKK